MRGAGVATYQVKPDIALVLEGTTASDVPGTDDHKHATSLGQGPAITVMDRTSIPHPPLVQELFSLAEDEGIKVQVRRNTAGELMPAKSRCRSRRQGCNHCRTLPLHPFTRIGSEQD